MKTPPPTSREDLAQPADPDLPPVGAALLAEIDAIKPVPTRQPARAALLLGLAAGAIPVIYLLAIGPRQDLTVLPLGWVIAAALAWIAGVLAALLAATLPRRGAVLPDAGRAGWAASLVAAGLLLLGLFATVDARGSTLVLEPTWAAFCSGWLHCTSHSLTAALPLLVLGGLVLRRMFPVGGVRIAAALGAAAGATVGLALHFVCPIGGGLHVGLAHAGGVTLGAVLGMILLPRLLRL
jgi:hypothetical protein